MFASKPETCRLVGRLRRNFNGSVSSDAIHSKYTEKIVMVENNASFIQLKITLGKDLTLGFKAFSCLLNILITFAIWGSMF